MIDNDEEYDFLEEYALDEDDYEWYEVYDEKQHLTDKEKIKHSSKAMFVLL